MIPIGTPTTDISDAHPDLDICETQFHQYGGRTTFGGPIRTLKCLDDTALLMRVLAEPGHGAVLVVDGEASLRSALLGDRHAGLAAAGGWAGLIINGAVRDVTGIGELDLGVKALGVTPRRSGKTAFGAVDIPVRFGTARFVPGGFVWSDENGIVVAPPEWESDSLEPAPQPAAYQH
jgi:regulator of ribonuclease activity A